MRAFLSKFNYRKQEIHRYFHFVSSIEIDISEKNYILTVDDESFSLIKVLKANCYLMLYNLVEGSVTEAIDAIFEAISIQNISFNDLIPAYKKIWLSYKGGLVKITTESAKAKDPTKNKIGKSITDVLDNLAHFKIATFTDKDGTTYDN